MFLVLNKDKIYAYAVSVLTVVVLFFVATNFNNNKQVNSTETSAGTSSGVSAETNTANNINNSANIIYLNETTQN